MCSLKNTTVSTSIAKEYIRIRIRINHFFCLFDNHIENQQTNKKRRITFPNKN